MKTFFVGVFVFAARTALFWYKAPTHCHRRRSDRGLVLCTGSLLLGLFLVSGVAHAQQTRALHIGNQSVTLTSDKRSTPALAVQMPEGDIWYGFLTSGTAPGRLTVQMPDNQIYSLTAPPPPLVHGKFQVTLNNMPANSQFSFELSAMGDFEIDWGLGTVPQVINKTNTTLTTYTSPASPRYSGGPYIVTIRGRATSYNSGEVAAIAFNNSLNRTRIIDIAGDLGSIFPILGITAASRPRFIRTFQNLTGLTGPIPPNLFAGVQGPPASAMFASMFEGCTSLTGEIPESLFAGIQGPPTTYIFSSTFRDCRELTGPIPSNLFAGIQGPPASRMFMNTFINCSGLTGEIPGSLFVGIQGAPAANMFGGTFRNARSLTGIGTGLFDGISGAAQTGMFENTFYDAVGLRGPAARFTNGQLLHQRWPAATTAQVGGAFIGATGLDNWSGIPAAWR